MAHHDPAALATARRFGLTLNQDAASTPRRESGKVTDFLLAHGWTRDDRSHADECGRPGEATSFCHRPARWSKPEIGPGGIPRCAAHARIMEDQQR